MFTKRLIRRARSLGIGSVLVAVLLAVMPGQFVSAQNSAQAGQARKPTASAAVKPTVVLVHGDWADSSSCAGEITRLQGDGFTVVAPPNHVIPPNAQRSMANRANAHISEFDGGHLGLISDPDAVVEVIHAAVEATS